MKTVFGHLNTFLSTRKLFANCGVPGQTNHNYYGPCDLKTNDFSSVKIHKDINTEEVINVDPIEVQCAGKVVRKEENLMDSDINANKMTEYIFSLVHVNVEVELFLMKGSKI